MKRIDFHTHFVPKLYRSALEKSGVFAVGRVPFPEWDLDQQFANMEVLGIEKALLSISSPGVDFFEQPRHCAELATALNDMLIDYKARHDASLCGFATLPLSDPELALRELERLSGSGLSGVILLSNTKGRYLSHPEFEPLLSALNQMGAIVLVHPGVPEGAENYGLSLPPPILEFTFDTTRLAADMIFTGVPDRYPNIDWILSHMGGTLPYVAWRLSLIEKSNRDAYAAFKERGKSVHEYLASFYYDTAVSASSASLSAFLDIIPASQLLFGSDIPFLPMNFATETTKGLDAFEGWSEDELRAVNRDNGLTLLNGRGL